MPLYEYRCDSCALLFEELVSASTADQVACPKCKGSSVSRQLSVFAAHGASAEPACASACAEGGCGMAMRPSGGGGCCGGACSH